MKKSVILNLSLLVLVTVLVSGCQTLGVGPSERSWSLGVRLSAWDLPMSNSSTPQWPNGKQLWQLRI